MIHTTLNQHIYLGHARKQYQRERTVIGKHCKIYILQLFNQGIAEDGTIDRTKKVSPQTAVKLLKAKVTSEGWDKSNILTEQQIRSLFSRYKNDRTKRGHKAMKAIEVNNIVNEVVQLSSNEHTFVEEIEFAEDIDDTRKRIRPEKDKRSRKRSSSTKR